MNDARRGPCFALLLGLCGACGCTTTPSADTGDSGTGADTGDGGTGSESGGTGELPDCGGDVVTVNGQDLAITEMVFSSVGIGGGEFADLAEIRLEGDVILTLQFLMATQAGDTISISTEPDATQGAFVINYAGFEGGPQDLCDRNGQNGATAGSFSFELLERGPDFVTSACGELELSFTGCDFSELGISGDVTFTGAFRG